MNLSSHYPALVTTVYILEMSDFDDFAGAQAKKLVQQANDVRQGKKVRQISDASARRLFTDQTGQIERLFSWNRPTP